MQKTKFCISYKLVLLTILIYIFMQESKFIKKVYFKGEWYILVENIYEKENKNVYRRTCGQFVLYKVKKLII